MEELIKKVIKQMSDEDKDFYEKSFGMKLEDALWNLSVEELHELAEDYDIE